MITYVYHLIRYVIPEKYNCHSYSSYDYNISSSIQPVEVALLLGWIALKASLSAFHSIDATSITVLEQRLGYE